MAGQYLVARNLDNKVVGVRVTPRAYTHAVVVDNKSVASWHQRADLAYKAATAYPRAIVVSTEVGTPADLKALKPRMRQQAQVTACVVMERTSTKPCTEVDVLDLVDLGGIVEAVEVPAWWQPYAWADGTADEQRARYVERERAARRAMRAEYMAKGIANEAVGGRTLWLGWYTVGTGAGLVAPWALAGFRATTRRVQVTSTVVG